MKCLGHVRRNGKEERQFTEGVQSAENGNVLLSIHESVTFSGSAICKFSSFLPHWPRWALAVFP